MASFLGEYHHAIDQKSRIVIPTRWLKSIDPMVDGEGFFITPGYDNALVLYTPRAWRVEEERLNSIEDAKPKGRMVQRLSFAGSHFSECDPQGRILIESEVRRASGLREKVVMLGLSQRLEMWDEEAWYVYKREAMKSFDRTRERLMQEGGGR